MRLAEKRKEISINLHIIQIIEQRVKYPNTINSTKRSPVIPHNVRTTRFGDAKSTVMRYTVFVNTYTNLEISVLSRSAAIFRTTVGVVKYDILD